MALVSNFPGRNVFRLSVLSVCGIVSAAEAQESVSVEHSTLEPSISAEFRYDDNIFLSATDEQSSLITVLSPRLLAIIKPPRHRMQLSYEGEFASYASSSTDNYDDHDFQAAASFDLGRRGLLDVIGAYRFGHENRGAGLSEGLDPGSGAFLNEPDEYSRRTFGGRFAYGATGTRGHLVFEGGRRELEYSNNRDRTRFFDYDDTYGGATFYLRVMPSTSLLMTVRANSFDYPTDRSLQPSLDSREERYLIGATWNVTGKSTGTVRFGYVRKRYEDAGRPDFSDTSWEVDVRWSLRSYSHLEMATSRYPSEVTSATGDVVENTRYSIAWSHNWTARIITRLATLHSRRDFRGSVGARAERYNQHRFTFAYDMRRWLTWEFGVSVGSQNSNIDRFNSDVKVVSLGANLTF